MKYRSSTEIIDLILRSANSGATRTRIMYKAYLSYSQLKEYLSFLQEKELIAYEEGAQIYRITEKGLRFINAYDEIRELVSEEPDHTPHLDNIQTSDKITSKRAVAPNW